VGAVLSLAALIGGAASAAPGPLPPAGSASVVVSPARAGAQPVAMTLVLGYEMQCGYPGPGPLLVRFPPQERVPRVIAAGAVRADGRAVAAAPTAGNVVRIALPPRPQVMCDVIGPGRLTVVFSRTAGLGNPAAPGAYTLTARRGPTAFSARFAIHPA
jgi:hypothetical protein